MTVSAAVPFRRMVSVIATGCFRMKMAKSVAPPDKNIPRRSDGCRTRRFLRQGCGSRWGELDVNEAKSRHGGGLAFLLLGLPWPYKVRSPERPRRVSDVIKLVARWRWRAADVLFRQSVRCRPVKFHTQHQRLHYFLETKISRRCFTLCFALGRHVVSI